MSKFNQTAGRLQNAGERVSVAGGGKAGSVIHIPPYKPTYTQFGKSRVIQFQQLFKMTGHGDAPVFLRTPRDVLMYRGIMALSVVGIGMTLYGVGSMATGSMQRKK